MNMHQRAWTDKGHFWNAAPRELQCTWSTSEHMHAASCLLCDSCIRDAGGLVKVRSCQQCHQAPEPPKLH